MNTVPPYPYIYEGLCERRIIPFFGSGVSLGGRDDKAKWRKGENSYPPQSNELADHLANLIKFPDGEPRHLPTVAQYFEIVVGRPPLNHELHNIFNHNFALTVLHNFLVQITKPLLIVTTNYDDMIERVFDQAGRPYDKVIHTTDPILGDRIYWWPTGAVKPKEVLPKKLDIDLEKVTVIYKMHGSVDGHQESREQYVITEDDYIDFVVRMTKEQAIPAIFADPFQTRHFLFLGHSLRDWNLRVVLSRIEKDLRRPKAIRSWSIQEKPSQLEMLFWEHRHVQV
jgi:hypothetical protein